MSDPETSIVNIDPQSHSLVQSPADIIDFYTDVANRLSDIVEQQQLFSVISTKKHLDAEAWETIIALDGAIPQIEWVQDIVQDGETIGFKARAIIVKNGATISSGEMSCGLDDFPCRGKSGVAARRSGESTAQTWAIAKAARLKYAWVVTLAGYDPLPSNEARDIVHNQPVAATTQRRAAPPARQQPPAKAPEPAAQPSQETEGSKPPGEAVKIPNQVSVPEDMTGIQFVDMLKQVGWDKDNGKEAMRLLGAEHTIPEWLREMEREGDYNYAWSTCIEAWKKEQVTGLSW